MVRQHLEQEQEFVPPRIARPGHQYQQILENETPKYVTFNNWLWPVASWIVVFTKLAIVIVAIRDMYSTTYSPTNDIFITITSVAVLAGIAAVYRFILKEK